MARTQYGILGIYGCCAVDRNTYECGILGNKAKEKNSMIKKWFRKVIYV